jgi:hypothetical protein
LSTRCGAQWRFWVRRGRLGLGLLRVHP